MALQPRHARNVPRRVRPPRRRRRALRPPLSRPPRPGPHSALRRWRLRRAVQARRRGRRLRPAALGRDADLPPRLLRRRRRSPHQPHHPRPGSPHQHLQAPAHLRGPRRPSRPSSRICRCSSPPTAPSSPSASTAPSSASPPIATPAFCRRPSSTSSACSAGRPRTTASSSPSTSSPPPSLSKASTAPTPSSTLPKKTPSIPRPSGSTPSTSAPCPSTQLSRCLQPFFAAGRLRSHAGKAPRRHPAHPRAHQAAARRRLRRRLFLPHRTRALRPRRADPAKGGDAALALRVLQHAQEVLATTTFDHDSLDQALRAAAAQLGLKAGQPVPAHPRRRLRTQKRAAAL